MKLKNVAGLFAAILLTFAVVACNNDNNATPTPAESPAATEAAG